MMEMWDLLTHNTVWHNAALMEDLICIDASMKSLFCEAKLLYVSLAI